MLKSEEGFETHLPTLPQVSLIPAMFFDDAATKEMYSWSGDSSYIHLEMIDLLSVMRSLSMSIPPVTPGSKIGKHERVSSHVLSEPA